MKQLRYRYVGGTESPMHPPLAPHLHGEECRKIIKQLHKCHEEHSVRKFFGACNDLKRSLDRCLTKEYFERRQKNYDLAQKKKKVFKKLYEE